MAPAPISMMQTLVTGGSGFIGQHLVALLVRDRRVRILDLRPPAGTPEGVQYVKGSVLDSAVVDARRRLVLIRRDNVEHLILIGGPTDVVVEANVVRAQSAAAAPSVQRAPQRAPIEPIEPDYDPSLVPFDEPEFEEPVRPMARQAPPPPVRREAPMPAPAPVRPAAAAPAAAGGKALEE